MGASFWAIIIIIILLFTAKKNKTELRIQSYPKITVATMDINLFCSIFLLIVIYLLASFK